MGSQGKRTGNNRSKINERERHPYKRKPGISDNHDLIYIMVFNMELLGGK